MLPQDLVSAEDIHLPLLFFVDICEGLGWNATACFGQRRTSTEDGRCSAIWWTIEDAHLQRDVTLPLLCG